jgi:magnesium-transporting ATPase (P-type)
LIDQIENAKRSYGIGNNDASNGYKNVQSLNSLSIVIDGPTLELVLGNAEIEEKFFSFALYARSVVCCRVSPKQKASIVKLSKYKKGSISLSVGDGANDVPMIMEANVGVGIRGKEGTQAVRSADYAISQFEFLQRLLLIHGRLGYRRVSWVI